MSNLSITQEREVREDIENRRLGKPSRFQGCCDYRPSQADEIQRTENELVNLHTKISSLRKR